MNSSSTDPIDAAREVLLLEATALQALAGRLDRKFAACCHAISECSGRVIVLGIGKSGHIAQKIAATFASTGTLAFFVHPAEAGHGDLGMIAPDDLVLALSNSGETPELLGLIPQLRKLGVPLIALTGAPDSTLAQRADFCLEATVEREACPLNLAPTTSTTTALALGDALAVALMRIRGFDTQDFARSHPAGSLGKRLLTTAGDVMRDVADVPQVPTGTLLHDALSVISEKGLGLTTIMDSEGALIGIFTDGDLRRCLSQGVDLYTTVIDDVMTRDFQTARADELAADILLRMRNRKVSALPVLDGEQVVGALHMHDLIALGISPRDV